MGIRAVLAGILVVLGSALLVLAGCGRTEAAVRAPGPMRVVVTVAPLAGLVRPVLPPGATVSTLIAPGRSEHGYELTPQDLSNLAGADLVVYVGLGLEPQVEAVLKKKPVPTRRVVCFADAVGIKPDDHHDHDHHEGDGHDHGSQDPHLWLDPALCAKLIPTVAAAVQGALSAPGMEAPAGFDVAAARDKAVADINALDEELKTTLAPVKGRAIVTHHAAWERLAERYGLKVAAVIQGVEGGEPTPAATTAAVQAIRMEGVKAVFVEPQFNAAAAERIAQQAGVKVGQLDPIGDGDWFRLMRENAASLVRNLGD